MERTITIKGVGKATIKPDYVIISLAVEAKEKKYANAVESAAKKINKLNSALQESAPEAGNVMTVSYNVRADYNFVRDWKNQEQRQLDGYVCVHRLKIEFDYDTTLLGTVLSAISGCLANPQLDISFTVKDKDAVNQELLNNVVKSAQKKAETLCCSSGVSLGKLLKIDYNWNDINIFSKADLQLKDISSLALPNAPLPTIDIHPNDINVTDTATFVWEIM